MKTVAELKRDANGGKMSLEMIEWYGKTGDEIRETLRGIRKVLRANTVAIILLNRDGNESEMRLNSAKLVDYDGENLTVYEAGKRDLTEQEQRILDEWQRIEDDYYKNNPYGDAYWKRKDFFAKCACPWLTGYEFVKGKYLTYNGDKRVILDRSIKGEAILKYKVYFEA